MSHKKIKINNIDSNNLIGNLRGEVGGIIVTWILLKDVMAGVMRYRTGDFLKDEENPRYVRLRILMVKLSDEIVSRLSELATDKVGQATFYFAGQKLNMFSAEVQEFQDFIKKNRFIEKRNWDISHKQLPDAWEKHKTIIISDITLLKGIAKALRLMKKIDKTVLGPSSKYFWREMRKKRYEPMRHPESGYAIMQYLRLSKKDRAKIIQEEIKQKIIKWDDAQVLVNGRLTTLKICKKWGAIILGQNMLIVMEEYPIIELKAIDIS